MRKKNVLLLTAFAGLLAALLILIGVVKEMPNNEELILTVDQRNVLLSAGAPQDRLDEGILLSSEERLLEWLAQAQEFMAKRYPREQFTFIRVDNTSPRGDNCRLHAVSASAPDRVFTVKVTEDGCTESYYAIVKQAEMEEIVREEFGEGNEFCKKVTYAAENPESVLSSFRNDYYPRIAVTVDMIATGTDVKPIECLIFMRDVRSKNYFEQMKGRGTRTLGKDDLQKVTPSATENKDHFVIVDAVGVTKSKKSDTRTLERKPTVSMKELMMNVALGAKDEDTLTSLASRIIRLNSQMTVSEKKAFTETVGVPAANLAENLLNAFDEDVLTAKAQTQFSCAEPTQEQITQVQKEAITEAVKPFHDPEVREFIENVRRSHEQIVDNVNIDTVTFAGFDKVQEANADRVIQSFRDFIEANKDEIIALRIIYSQTYKDRPMVINKLQSLYEKLKAQGITIDRLWDCYALKKPDKVRGKSTMHQLADLIAIIRFEMGYGDNLQPFAETVNYNFMRWTLKRNAGAVHFSEEQMEWLRLIKDHIAVSLSIEPEDLDLNPFDRRGGLGRFYEVFGGQYEEILAEMNIELVA